MQFHKHLYQMGISESLNAIGADLTNLDKGRRIYQNVGGVPDATTKGS